MKTIWRPFASYNLWSLFAPPIGQERWHCDMKRGFQKARKKEPSVADLLDKDNIPERIGHLAQKGIYEFHQDTELLNQSDGAEKVAEILELNQEADEVQGRVISILINYHKNPILVGRNILHILPGDEGFPTPITIRQGSYIFNFFAAIDCIFTEQDGTLHILDFKTGKSDFDRRQAYVYLLAASYLYPQQKAVASFYNLETGNWSNSISATDVQLKAILIELAQIAQRHELEKERYKKNPAEFAQIFPPNPGSNCQYCPFNLICEFSEG